VTVSDWFNNFFNPKGLDDPQNAQALDDVLNEYENEGPQLARTGTDLVEAILTSSGADLSEVTDKIDELTDGIEDLFTPIEIDPEDFKARVIKGSVALQALDDFRLTNLKDFYTDKLSELKDQLTTTFDPSTFRSWADQMKKMQFSTVLEEFLSVLGDILDIALEIKDLLDFVTTKQVELSDAMLSQTRPEKKVDGPHRTRRVSA
jgi:hypothetical protein